MTPEELKKVRVKVFLLLGLLSLIPILTAAIFIVRYHKKHPTNKKPPRVVDNDYDKGRSVSAATFQLYMKANSLYDQRNEAEAEPLYRQCKADFARARAMILKCRQANPGDDYSYMDQEAAQIVPWIRTVDERLFQMEMRGTSKPPPAGGGQP